MTATLDTVAGEPEQVIAELRRELTDARAALGARTAERDEALAQQEATAEVLEIIHSSPGDLAPVFEAMLERAMNLCEADFGGLWTGERGLFRAVALRGVPAPYSEFYDGNPPEFGPGTGPALIQNGKRLAHIADMADTDAYRAGEPNRRALVDLGGARTALVV